MQTIFCAQARGQARFAYALARRTRQILLFVIFGSIFLLISLTAHAVGESTTSSELSFVEGKTPVAAPEPHEKDAVDHMVISEVRISGGSGKSTDEFVELYNPTTTTVDITGWQLVKWTRLAKFEESTALLDSFPATTTIPAHGYLLVAHDDYQVFDGVLPDVLYRGQSLSDDNSVALVDAVGQVVDLVGWGKATNFEGTAAALSPTAAFPSLERLPGGLLGNHWDTDESEHDFVRAKSTPQNSLSAPASPVLSDEPVLTDDATAVEDVSMETPLVPVQVDDNLASVETETATTTEEVVKAEKGTSDGKAEEVVNADEALGIENGAGGFPDTVTATTTASSTDAMTDVIPVHVLSTGDETSFATTTITSTLFADVEDGFEPATTSGEFFSVPYGVASSTSSNSFTSVTTTVTTTEFAVVQGGSVATETESATTTANVTTTPSATVLNIATTTISTTTAESLSVTENLSIGQSPASGNSGGGGNYSPIAAPVTVSSPAPKPPAKTKAKKVTQNVVKKKPAEAVKQSTKAAKQSTKNVAETKSVKIKTKNEKLPAPVIAVKVDNQKKDLITVPRVSRASKSGTAKSRDGAPPSFAGRYRFVPHGGATSRLSRDKLTKKTSVEPAVKKPTAPAGTAKKNAAKKTAKKTTVNKAVSKSKKSSAAKQPSVLADSVAVTTEVAKLHNMPTGQLVAVAGEVTDVKSAYWYVDDGSGEVKVSWGSVAKSARPKILEGSQVRVAGVAHAAESGEYELRPRYAEDVVVMGETVNYDKGSAMTESSFFLANSRVNTALAIAGGCLAAGAGYLFRRRVLDFLSRLRQLAANAWKGRTDK